METTVNMTDFLNAMSSENRVVRKLAAKAVLDFRTSRDPYVWNDYLKQIVAQGVYAQRLTKYRMDEIS